MRVRSHSLAVCILLLAGCQSPQSLWDDYLSRLSRVLDQPIPQAIPVARAPAYPAKRSILVDIPESRISLVDAWNIRHCDLFEVISERNSILGKVSEPEIRAGYEWRLLRSLPLCIADEETPEDIQAELRVIESDKDSQFSASIWNATFANDDFMHQFSRNERLIHTDETFDINGYGERLNRLAGFTRFDGPPLDSAFIEASEYTSRFSLAGAALRSQRLAIAELRRADTMLTKATEEQYLCPGNKFIRPELDIARNVLIKVFIQQIQPWLNLIEDAHRNSIGSSQTLFASFDAGDFREAYQFVETYLAEASAINDDFKAALKEHARLWQSLFDSCGASVTPA